MSMTKHIAAASILASLIGGAALISSAHADDMSMPKMEKCFGVAKAGSNDCASKTHSCKAMGKTDRDKTDFVELPAGTCAKLAGGRVG